MSETLTIVVAIFGLIGLGYGAARTGLLARSVGEGLTEYVFKIAIPLLLFDTLATADLQGLSPWRLWAAYFVPFAAVWALSHLMIRRVFGREARAGVVAGGSAAYSNTVLIGIPLVQVTFGEAGMVYLIAIVAVHLAVMMVLTVVLDEWARRADGMESGASRRDAMRRLGVALATHPVLLGIVAGLLWRLAGRELPAPLAIIVEQLGRTGGPLSLFASGMALVNFGMTRQIRPALAIAGLKLLVMPALVFMAARAVGLPAIGVAVATLTAACPTGVNIFLVASQLGTGQALASNALLISTAGGVVTVTLWLAFLQTTVG